MQSLVLAAVLSLAAARPQLPAGDRHHNYDHIYSKEGVRCQRTQNNFFFFSKQLTQNCPPYHVCKEDKSVVHHIAM